jgi:hypothetical protein
MLVAKSTDLLMTTGARKTAIRLFSHLQKEDEGRQNSKAVHHAYARNAQVTLPPLEDAVRRWIAQRFQKPNRDQDHGIMRLDIQHPSSLLCRQSSRQLAKQRQ